MKFTCHLLKVDPPTTFGKYNNNKNSGEGTNVIAVTSEMSDTVTGITNVTGVGIVTSN